MIVSKVLSQRKSLLKSHDLTHWSPSFAPSGKVINPMLRKATTFTTFCNNSREANLSSAKRALKRFRGAHLHRDTTGDDDVIDIVVGAEIMEQHICKCPRRIQSELCEQKNTQPQSTFVRYFRIEDLALYQ